MKIPIWLLAAVLSILAASAGQIMLKFGVRGAHLPENPLAEPLSLVVALLQPFIIGGIAAYGTSMVLWLAAINGRQLSAVYPLASLGYIVITVLSVWLFGERITTAKVAGIALIVVGVIVLNSGLGGGTTDADDRAGLVHDAR